MTARRLPLRAAGLSLRLDAGAAALLGGLLVAIAAVLALNLARGELAIAPLDVLAALVGAGDEADRFIVVDLRLPRALVAVLAGAALGVAGAILQDVARNPLVAPDIVGITLGASLAAVSVIVLADADGALAVPAAALGGALAAGATLYLLAWRGGVHGYRLVLIGVGLTALLQAAIEDVLTRGRIFDVAEAYVWLVGSLNATDWAQVWPLAIGTAVLLPLAFALGRRLEALQLGDDVARALGVRVEPARLALLVVAVLLCGMAVAASGPIAFAAFVSPHLARRLGRTVAPSAVLPLSAAVGALLVSSADAAGRLLFAPTQIPVGIITAILAAPYFLVLLRRADRLGVTG